MNDYFSSFDKNNNANNSDDESSEEKKKGKWQPRKYIGHGRMGGSGTGEGGAFDVNNYFDSFNNNDDDDLDKSSMSSDGYTYDSTFNKQQEQPQQQSISRDMTYEEIIAYNNARLCPKLLLTQRAIQSFIFLLEECRDPHSGKVRHFCYICRLGYTIQLISNYYTHQLI